MFYLDIGGLQYYGDVRFVHAFYSIVNTRT